MGRPNTGLTANSAEIFEMYEFFVDQGFHKNEIIGFKVYQGQIDRQKDRRKTDKFFDTINGVCRFFFN